VNNKLAKIKKLKVDRSIEISSLIGLSHTLGLLMSAELARQRWQAAEESFLAGGRYVFAIAVQLLPSHMVL
jgi:hypothetical protein